MCGKGRRDGTKDFRYLEFQREGGRGDEFLSRKLEAEATGRYEHIVLPFCTYVLAGIFFPLEKKWWYASSQEFSTVLFFTSHLIIFPSVVYFRASGKWKLLSNSCRTPIYFLL